MVWRLSLLERDTAIRVENLDKAVSISYSANTLRKGMNPKVWIQRYESKGMNPIILPPAMGN